MATNQDSQNISSPSELTKFKPDPQNLNLGTERGNYALERSLRDYGFARPVVADKEGVILAGNHAFQKAGEIGIKNIRVIETDGNEIIVHKRTDLDATTAKARMVALADNRTTEVNLRWDPTELENLLGDTEEVKNFFVDSELETYLPEADLSAEELFAPNTDPTQGAGQRVTDDLINSTEDDMNNRFTDAGSQSLVQIECPCCGETFTIDRTTL